MGKLIYAGIMSLDGYIEDAEGTFGWAEPDEEVHAFTNDRYRSFGTYLYGRRMYETMAAWETLDTGAGQAPVYRDFALLWRAADKVVHSTKLVEPSTARTRVERDFDADAVRRLKATAEADIAVAGPGLAAHAIRAGLVDEWHLYVVPVVVGGGKRYLPDGVRLDLELLEERRFGNGTVFLRYHARA